MQCRADDGGRAVAGRSGAKGYVDGQAGDEVTHLALELVLSAGLGPCQRRGSASWYRN